MTDSERILSSWRLLGSYQRHKSELHDLALRLYGTLRHMNRGLPAITARQYQKVLARFIVQQDVFIVKMMQRKPYIQTSMYQVLSEHLAWYIIEQYWDDIETYPY